MKEYIIELSDNENVLSILVKAYNLHEIVRCKDCKHYHKGFNCDLLQKPIMKGDDWFCADGERRTDND